MSSYVPAYCNPASWYHPYSAVQGYRPSFTHTTTHLMSQADSPTDMNSILQILLRLASTYATPENIAKVIALLTQLINSQSKTLTSVQLLMAKDSLRTVNTILHYQGDRSHNLYDIHLLLKIIDEELSRRV